MKQLVVNCLLILMMAGCHAQDNKNENARNRLATADTSYKPKTDIRVNKKYDDKGNLIQFDSTYSYFYSSPLNGKSSIMSDSLFWNFKMPLRENYRSLLNSNMDSIFFNDSLFKYDFFNDDYFSKRFELNMQRFQDMFHKMDSIKTGMFRDSFPEGEIKKN